MFFDVLVALACFCGGAWTCAVALRQRIRRQEQALHEALTVVLTKEQAVRTREQRLIACCEQVDRELDHVIATVVYPDFGGKVH